MNFSMRIMLIVLIPVCAFTQEQLNPLENYKETRNYRLSRDLRSFALNTIRVSRNQDVIQEAIQDLLKHSNSAIQHEDALHVLDEVIANSTSESEAFRSATLGKGKLLKRLGRDAESKTLFHKSIQQRMLHAMWRYSESLIDAGELDEASKLEYRRVIGLGDYAHYRAEKEDFFIFITLLRMMKNNNPNVSAMDQVFADLEDSTAYPQAKNIMKALCLTEDGSYQDAIDLLKQVDIQLVANSNIQSGSILNEYRNIPLYITSAMLYQDEDLNSVGKYFKDFLIRNQSDPRHIYVKTLKVVRDLEVNFENDMRKAHVITAPLLTSGIVTGPTNAELFSEEEIAALYELHGISLMYDGRMEEGIAVQKTVMNSYYPQTLAGATCAMNWARYTAWTKWDFDTAEGILLGILRDAPYPESLPWVKLSLAQIYHHKKETVKALEYVNEVLDLVTESDRGFIQRCREKAIELKQWLLSGE